PAAQESLGPAVLRRPLRRVRAALVIGLLHLAHLVLGREQRQDRRDLAALHPEPVLVGRRARRVLVDAGPLPRQRLDRVLGRAAAALGLLEQRLVVLLGGREAVRAHDRLAGIV